MNLTHKKISSFNETNLYIKQYFEDFFWNDFSNKDLYKTYINCGYQIILFQINDIPCALMAYKTHGNDSPILMQHNHEILLFEVCDSTYGRDRGVGEEVIKYFQKIIAYDRDICGYSYAASAPFWERVSTEVDQEVFDFLRDDNFEGEIMMFFKIKKK